MMLSRTGWGETPLPVAFQTVEGRRAPWGCAAGAPYRGTASPPPPPQHVCVCVCVCYLNVNFGDSAQVHVNALLSKCADDGAVDGHWMVIDVS